jgi:transposase-like protein
MELAIQPAAESSGKRRYRTVEERRRIVEETLAAGVSVAVVARRHGVNANQLFQWRKLISRDCSNHPLGSTSIIRHGFCR